MTGHSSAGAHDELQPRLNASDPALLAAHSERLLGKEIMRGFSKDDDESSRASAPRGHGTLMHAVIMFLAVVSVFALTSISLGILTPNGSRNGHNADVSTQESSGLADAQIYQVYQDEVPDAPQLRDADEYVLSPSWDFNAAPTTREHTWTITDALLNPDGVGRPMILINNQFPGPIVELNIGDLLIVHVINRATNATSIHFHGMFQNGTNAQDGTVGITGCPIAPGTEYTYQFRVQGEGQSGTYWYHAHHSAQASDGLLGPVVVHAPNERTELQKLDYATDRVLMVQDHYHNTTAELLMDYLRPGKENEEPVPDGALINGRGMRDCDDFPGWNCDSTDRHFPILALEQGKRHRLRFINAGAFAEFQIQVDEHPFFITEVDGTDVHPEPFHRLNILPGQRYSMILETNVTSSRNGAQHTIRHDGDHEDQGVVSVDSFWLRARMVSRCFAVRNEHMKPEILAIIRYIAPSSSADDEEESVGGLQEDPTSRNWDDAVEVICRDLDTSALRPVVEINPPEADVGLVTLRAAFHIGDWRLSRGFFNDSTWRPDVTNPTLLRLLDAAAEAPENMTSPASTSDGKDRYRGGGGMGWFGPAAPNIFDASRDLVLEARQGSVSSKRHDGDDDEDEDGQEQADEQFGSWIRTIDIAIDNFEDTAHPFHLHGHKFFVLTPSMQGYPPSPEELPAYLEETGVLTNPLRRDTVTVTGYEWVIIRVVLDNPGLWALHCHNTWHAEAGMVMQLLVRGPAGDLENNGRRKRHGDEDHDEDEEADEIDGHENGMWGFGEAERDLCKRPGIEKGVRPDDSIWFGDFGGS